MKTTKKDNSTGKAMILTDRDRRLIAAVADFGILTRAQIARHCQFGSVTRVNAVLLRLVRHGYLTRRLQPTLRGTRRQTYVVGVRGVELLQGASESHRQVRRGLREASDLFIEHRLLVNDVQLAFEHASLDGYELRRWMKERELRNMNLGIVPDAYLEYALDGNLYSVFVEADNGTETLGRWHEKVKLYLDLAFSGRYTAAFGRQYFRVLVVLPSNRRLETVRGEIRRQTDRILWFTTFNDVQSLGVFGPIWRRPTGSNTQSLIS